MRSTTLSITSLRRQLCGTLLALVITVEPLGLSVAPAATIYWDGTSASWNTNTNWSTTSGALTPDPATVPAASDDVIFNITTVNGAEIITLDANQAAKSLTFNNTDTTTLLGGGTARTLTIGTGGVTIASGTGAVTLGDGTTANDVLISLAQGAQAWTNNSSSNFTINNSAATVTRASGATLTFNQAGSGTFNINATSLPNVNDIVGPWAFFGTGGSATYARNNAGTIVGLGYTGGTDGVDAGATSTNVVTGGGSLNYTLSAGGTLGASASINTLRYTGGTGTLTTSTAFTTNGLMNVGGGTLTISGAVTIPAAGELVVNAANGDITLSSAITNNTGALTKTGTGILTLNAANGYTGTTTVNAGELRWGVNNALSTGNLTVNNGGTVNMNGFTDTVGTVTLNAGGTINTSAAGLLLTTGSGGFITTGGTVNNWPGIGLGGNFVYNTAGGSETTASIGGINMGGATTRTFTIADGVQAIDVDITVSIWNTTNANASIIKAGPGTMRIGGAQATDNYNIGTGTTTIQDGVLLLNRVTGYNTVGGSGTVTVGDGTGAAGSAILRYTNGNDQIPSNAITILSDGLFDLNGRSETTSGALTHSSGGSLTTGAGTLTLGAATNTISGASTVTGNLTFSGTATTNLTIGNTANINGTTTFSSTGGITSTGTPTIQGTLALGSAATHTITVTSGTIDISATVTGSTGVTTKNGAGTLTLSGSSANTYSGSITVGAGTVSLNKSGTANAIAGTLNINGALVQYASTAGSDQISDTAAVTLANGGGVATLNLNGISDTIGSLTFGGASGTTTSQGIVTTGAGTLTLNGNVSYISTGASSMTHTISGNLNLGAATRTLSVQNNGAATDLDISAAISGTSAGLIKTASGTLQLSGTNTYTGVTTVSQGILQINKKVSLYNNNTAGTGWTAANINVASGATLTLNVDGSNGFDTTSLNTLLTAISVANNSTSGLQAGAIIGLDTTNAGGSYTQGNAIANSTGASGGMIGLTKFGTGTLVLDKANTFTGITTLSAGTLQLAHTSALGGGNAITFTGGTFQFTSNNTNDYSSRFMGNTSAIILDTNGQSVTFVGAVNAGNTGGLTKTGTGTLTLSAANGFSGITTVSAGTLTLNNTLALQNSALDTTSAGTVTLSGPTTLTLGGLSGATGNLSSTSPVISSGFIGTVTDLTLNPITGASYTYGGEIGNGGMNLIKTGAGTQILSGANTYTGTTTINAGTLTIGSGGSLNGTTGTALTFSGTGTFNVQEAAGVSQGMGALTFSGGDGTVTASWNNGAGSGNTALTFANLSARAVGATGNFTLAGTGSTAINNRIALTTATNAPLTTGSNDAGLFFGGSNYARYNSSTNTFAAVAYGSDTNANTSLSGNAVTTLGAIDATKDSQFVGASRTTTTSGAVSGTNTNTLAVTDGTVFGVGQRITGTNIAADTYITAISGNTLTLAVGVGGNAIGGTAVAANTTLTPYNAVTAQTTGSVNTLNLSGAGASLAIASGNTLSVNGILRSGQGAGISGVISGGTGIQTATSGADLVIRTDLSTDSLFITTPILPNGTNTLVKSGAGTLTLNGTNTYTGGTVINGGTVIMSALDAKNLGGTGANITFNGPGTLQGSYGGAYSFGSLAINSTATLAGGSGPSNYMTFTGPVTGSGTLNFSSSGNGYGTTLNFTSTANTFTGSIIYLGNANNNPDTIIFNSIADGVGARSIQVGANTRPTQYFSYGSGAIAPLTLNYRQIVMGGTTGGSAVQNLNTTYALTVNTPLGITGVGNKTLTLDAAAGPTNVWNSAISNGPGSVISLAKTSAGTWVLTNSSNSYSGTTTVTGGTLSVSSLANGGSNSNIGASSNDAVNLILNGGTLKYTGADVSTDRLFALSASSTIDASGTGALNFTNTGSMGFNGGTAAKTLTFTGSNTGNNTIAAAIGDNSGATAITKSGPGTWVLAGLSSYTGVTTVNSGKLILTGSIGATSALTMANGTLEVNPSAASQTMASLGVTGGTAGSNLIVGAGKTLAFTSGTFSLSNWTAVNFDISASGSVITLPVTTKDTYLGGANALATVLNSTGFGFAAVGSGTPAPLNQIYRLNSTLLPASGASSSVFYRVDNNLTDPGSGAGTGVGGNNLTITATQTVGSVAVDTTARSGTLTLASGVILKSNEFAFGSIAASNSNTYTITGSAGGAGIGQAVGNNNINVSNYGGTVNFESPFLSTGSGYINFNGTGTTVLKGVNSYTGATNIYGSGTLQIGGAGSFNSGSYGGNISINSTSTFRHSSSANQTLSGLISGTGRLIKDTNSASVLTLSNAGNTYTGGTDIGAGTVSFATGALGATGNITFTGNSTLQWASGNTQDVSSRLVMTNGVTSTLDTNGNNVTLAAALGGGTSGNLTKSGTGTLTVTGANTYTGPTTVSAGTLQVGNGTTGSIATSSSVTNNANLNFLTSGAVTTIGGTGTTAVAQNVAVTANRVEQGTLTLDGDSSNTAGKLTINASGSPVNAQGNNSGTSRVNTLSIAGGAGTYHATLDLKNNDLMVNNTTPANDNAVNSQLLTINDMVKAGFNGGAWNGRGITSSYIGTQTPNLDVGSALGIMRNVMDPTIAYQPDSMLANYNPARYGTNGVQPDFDGFTLSGNETLVKYTYYGDADLDGKLTSFDFALLDAGFAQTNQYDGKPGWFFGDFNYDGTVGSQDYALMNLGYIAFSSPTGSGNPNIPAGTQLPEPSTLALGLFGVGGLLAIVRRQRLGR